MMIHFGYTIREFCRKYAAIQRINLVLNAYKDICYHVSLSFEFIISLHGFIYFIIKVEYTL